MITVLLADDQAMVRGAMAALLNLEPDIKVVAEVGRGDEVLSATQKTSVQVAVLDIEMPGLDGISVAQLLSEQTPDIHTLIVTTFGRPGYLKRALEAGALGFVVKDAPATELAAAIRKVAHGLKAIDPDLAIQSLSRGNNPLTEREKSVLSLAIDGAPIRDLAHRLCLSSGTVRNYLSSAMQKTGAVTRAQAISIAQDNGWL